MCRSRLVALWATFALGLTLAAACGDEEAQPVLRCDSVSCTGGMDCDETDGVCKCGAQGETCGDGELCVLGPSPSCVANLCAFVSCEEGNACNPESGACDCGGVVCEADERCVSGRCVRGGGCADVVCSEGMVCDPADLVCKCGGPGGLACGASESCRLEPAAHCVQERCAGKSCGTNSVCSPSDGACHCGGGEGEVCSTGEACVERDGVFACAISERCEDVVCDGGTLCDPDDGACRCGGVGADHPICGPTQSCIQGVCMGGDLCAPSGIPVVCEPGLSCDPDDGICKCGDALCGEGEGCTVLGERKSCTRLCTLLELQSSCGAQEGCYFDPKQPHGEAFCAPAGERVLGSSCEVANECRHGLYCNASSKCTQLCDIADGPSFCLAVAPDLECVPFMNGERIGYCRAP